MSKASSEWNSMVPKRHKHTHYGRTQHHEIEITNTANCHIQAPFKHSIVKSSPRPNVSIAKCVSCYISVIKFSCSNR